MSAAEWTGETSELAQPPKKRVPGWVWGCGAGCLLFTIVSVLLLAVGFRMFSKAMDQDAQWERIGQHLPFEQPPPGLHVFGFGLPFEDGTIWVLTDTAHHQQGVLFHAPPGSDATKTHAELFDATKEVSVMGMGRHDVTAGEVEVQGRRLRCVRYKALEGEGGGGPFGAITKNMQGASVVVDLAPEGSGELLALILTRQGTSEPVEDAAVVEFLAPFRIPGGAAEPAPATLGPPEEGK